MRSHEGGQRHHVPYVRVAPSSAQTGLVSSACGCVVLQTTRTALSLTWPALSLTCTALSLILPALSLILPAMTVFSRSPEADEALSMSAVCWRFNLDCRRRLLSVGDADPSGSFSSSPASLPPNFATNAAQSPQ